MIGQQLSDVVVQLEMGANAFRVFLQQGSQVAGLLGSQIGLWFAIGSAAALAVTGLMRFGEASTSSQREFERLVGSTEQSVEKFFKAADSAQALRQALSTTGPEARENIIETYAAQLDALNKQFVEFETLARRAAESLTLGRADRAMIQQRTEGFLGSTEFPGGMSEAEFRQLNREILNTDDALQRLVKQFRDGTIESFAFTNQARQLVNQFQQLLRALEAIDQDQENPLTARFRELTKQIQALEERRADLESRRARLAGARGADEPFPADSVLPEEAQRNIKELDELIDKLRVARDEAYRRVTEFGKEELATSKERLELEQRLAKLRQGTSPERVAEAETLARAIEILKAREQELKAARELEERERRRAESEDQRISKLREALRIEQESLEARLDTDPESYQSRLARALEPLKQRLLALNVPLNDERVAGLYEELAAVVALQMRYDELARQRQLQATADDRDAQNRVRVEANLRNIQRQTLALTARTERAGEEDTLTTRIQQFMLELEASGAELNDTFRNQLYDALGDFISQWNKLAQTVHEQEVLQDTSAAAQELSKAVLSAEQRVRALQVELSNLDKGPAATAEALALQDLEQFKGLLGTDDYNRLRDALLAATRLRQQLDSLTAARGARDDALVREQEQIYALIERYAALSDEVERASGELSGLDRVFGDLEQRAEREAEAIRRATAGQPELRERLLGQLERRLTLEQQLKRILTERQKLEGYDAAEEAQRRLQDQVARQIADSQRQVESLRLRGDGVSEEAVAAADALKQVQAYAAELRAEGLFSTAQIEQLVALRQELVLAELAYKNLKREQEERAAAVTAAADQQARAVDLYQKMGEELSDLRAELDGSDRVFGQLERRAQTLASAINKLKIPPELKELLLERLGEQLTSEESLRLRQEQNDRLKSLKDGAGNLEREARDYQRRLQDINREITRLQLKMSGLSETSVAAAESFLDLEQTLAGLPEDLLSSQRTRLEELLTTLQNLRQHARAYAEDQSTVRRDEEERVRLWSELRELYADSTYELENSGRVFGELERDAERYADQIRRLRIPDESKQALLDLLYESMSAKASADQLKYFNDRLTQLQVALDRLSTDKFEELMRNASRDLELVRQRIDGIGNESNEATIALRRLAHELEDLAPDLTPTQLEAYRKTRTETIAKTDELRIREEIEAAERRRIEDSDAAAQEASRNWQEELTKEAELRLRLNNLTAKDIDLKVALLRIQREFEANPYKDLYAVQLERDQRIRNAYLQHQLNQAEEEVRRRQLDVPKSREDLLDERFVDLVDEQIKLEQELSLVRLRRQNLEAENLDELISLEEYRLRLMAEHVPGDEEMLERLMRLREELGRQSAALEAEESRLERVRQLGESAGESIASGLWEAVKAGKALDQALADVLESLADLVVRYAMIEPFAQYLGGVARSYWAPQANQIPAERSVPTIHPHAKGGIFDRPTTFAMAKGIGVLGEAGPEAIMPLRRTSDGGLGVRATAPNIEVKVIDQRGSGEQVGVRTTQHGDRTVLELLVRDTVAGLVERGALDRQFGQRYGARPVAR